MENPDTVFDIDSHMNELFSKAKVTSFKLAQMNTNEKNLLLLKIADSLEKHKAQIIKANEADMKNASLDKDTKKSELDRLFLNDQRISSIAADIRLVANLPDPVGEETGWSVKNGLKIRCVKVPFGVIGAIYESRPNVTVDIAALCIKSGNAVILRGSSSAINSNRAIIGAIKTAFSDYPGLEGAVQLVNSTDREAVNIMLKARGKLDLLIPRGGAKLIQHTIENSKVPVIETGTGNCHVFVDESADFEMAQKIIINSKCQRPGVCNAEEKLLVHKKIAKDLLPKITNLLKEKGVEIRGCEETIKILKGLQPIHSSHSNFEIKPATEEDWSIEYLDLIIAIKVVDSLEQAIEHINKYNSKHTEAIVTTNFKNAQEFLKQIDAAVVNVNASTRFTDGGQFGFGAEIGISTQKLHARGPMGLKELTCNKYLVYGEGQIRE